MSTDVALSRARAQPPHRSRHRPTTASAAATLPPPGRMRTTRDRCRQRRRQKRGKEGQLNPGVGAGHAGVRKARRRDQGRRQDVPKGRPGRGRSRCPAPPRRDPGGAASGWSGSTPGPGPARRARSRAPPCAPPVGPRGPRRLDAVLRRSRRLSKCAQATVPARLSASSRRPCTRDLPSRAATARFGPQVRLPGGIELTQRHALHAQLVGPARPGGRERSRARAATAGRGGGRR